MWKCSTLGLMIGVSSSMTGLLANGGELIVPVSQQRSVSTSWSSSDDMGGTWSGSDSHAAPDFGWFVSSVGGANQDSSISANSIQAVGRASASASGSMCCSASDSASSRALFEFDLTEEVTYTLDVQLNYGYSGPFPNWGESAHFTLTGPGGEVLSGGAGEGEDIGYEFAVATSGVLSYGRYVMNVQAHASASSCCGDGGMSESASYNVQFTVVPEPSGLHLLAFAGLPLLFRSTSSQSHARTHRVRHMHRNTTLARLPFPPSAVSLIGGSSTSVGDVFQGAPIAPKNILSSALRQVSRGPHAGRARRSIKVRFCGKLSGRLVHDLRSGRIPPCDLKPLEHLKECIHEA